MTLQTQLQIQQRLFGDSINGRAEFLGPPPLGRARVHGLRQPACRGQRSEREGVAIVDQLPHRVFGRRGLSRRHLGYALGHVRPGE